MIFSFQLWIIEKRKKTEREKVKERRSEKKGIFYEN